MSQYQTFKNMCNKSPEKQNRMREINIWGQMLSHSGMSDSLRSLCAVAHQASLSMGFSRHEYWSEVKWKLLSHIQLFANPWTMQSVEFSKPEYWSG